MADETEYGERRRPRQSLDEDEDRFTPEERRELREVLRLLHTRKNDQAYSETLKSLLDQAADLQDIVQGKRVTAGVYRAIGEFAKWAAGVIGVIIAYRTLIGGK